MLKFNTCPLTCLYSKSNYSNFERVGFGEVGWMNTGNILIIIT